MDQVRLSTIPPFMAILPLWSWNYILSQGVISVLLIINFVNNGSSGRLFQGNMGSFEFLNPSQKEKCAKMVSLIWWKENCPPLTIEN